MEQATAIRETDIAVIGMACRFPGATTPEGFWKNLREGRESVVFYTEEELLAAGADPAELSHPGYVRAGHPLPGVELFDAGHFGVPDDEAEILDPQHRHFLECSLAALEDAGYDPSSCPDDIGLYAGAGMNTYLLTHLAERYRRETSVGRYRLMLANDKDFLATRVSYKLNLRGPSLSVNTACSTGLVAVHQAYLSLLAGECRISLAGAVHLRVPQVEGHVHQEGMIFSPDGHCRAFDADAGGTVISSGVGVVVLKRLADALADGDTVHAVIKGTAVNNDGSAKTGYTAPSVARQADVIRDAQRVADCAPETIGYVEAHGTGTPLGDPIEVAALTEAFDGVAPGGVHLGSVKTNIGHLDTAAGMAGLIKTVLMLRHRTLVPSLHFRTPNPDIDLTDGPFRIATTTAEWAGGTTPRRAGVSSFGVGGTNAHVVLEEPPGTPAPSTPDAPELLVLSARTPAALDRVTDELSRHLGRHKELDLAAVAHTLAVGRRAHAHRRAVVCEDVADAALTLAIGEPSRVMDGAGDSGAAAFAFVLPHMATTPVEDAAALHRSLRPFREAADACAAALPGGGPDVLGLLTGGGGDRLASFTATYALARTCQAAGVTPAALCGSGVGGVVAGCLAGVFGLTEALALLFGEAPATLAVPELPLSLGANGQWLRPEESCDPATWTTLDHGGECAQEALLKERDLIALDLAPSPGAAAPLRHTLLYALGRAWTQGAEVEWPVWYGTEHRRVPLPTYPYQRSRHWVEPEHTSGRESAGDGASGLRDRFTRGDRPARQALVEDFLRHQIATMLPEPGDTLPEADADLFELGMDSLMLIDVIARLGDALGSPVTAMFSSEHPTISALAGEVAR
ncbi:type I polyketide synthase [Streptomyces coffeae]|uniref:Beta-ketoacyl synthase n=1 Tax=Streptomyces coffeae TaxID=621382 RepID=A0ABS1NBR1_9ACTN|nr:beta-ketoacyl synthase N-terminal-like domain-containing protein [Streptomyces coffeae]MBL1097387.1 beta-ketoacyl synthase [Streptomyces coffeae]